MGGLKVHPLRQEKALGSSLKDKIALRQEASVLPEYVNWYEEGKVTRPYNQNSCGACWAFTAAATMESLAFMKGIDSTLQEYSVQQLVDCDTLASNEGCTGGWMYDAYGYTMANGIALKSDYYQYAAKQNKCNYDPSKSHFKPTGMVEQDVNTNEQLMAIVAQHPVGIAMYASGMLSGYNEGIVTEDFLKCSSTIHTVNHGITLVGYGKVKEGDRVRGECERYWIIRNSWGESWGEKGTFKLCMDNAGSEDMPFGTCLVNQYATWPNLDGIIIPPK